MKFYRRKFNHALEPFKVMLVDLQSSLPEEEWIRFVNQTRAGTIDQPDQYLGSDLPDKEMLQSVVTVIFDEFLEDRLRRQHGTSVVIKS